MTIIEKMDALIEKLESGDETFIKSLGESEVESGQVTVKNNQTREEVQVSLDAISQNFSKIFANIVLRYRII